MKYDTARLPLRLLGVITFIAATWGTAHAQRIGDTVYPKRDGTEILQDSNLRSATVATVDRGTPLTVVRLDGARLVVKTPAGKEGFVMKLRVTEDAPRTGSGIGITNDISPDERSNISSIRGLSPVAQEGVDSGAISKEAAADLDTIKKVSESISESKIASFMKEGGVEPK